MIRQRMIELRGKRSQQEMAELIGISQQQYSNIEQGKRGIKPKYFKKFEVVFNEDIHKLAPDIFLLENTP
ncbi:MAG: helix-turn-helix transcriptional regulator [Clostridia bacterium]|nr:helix-turn-helix transcriptional regulator [Clostridia bacterium]